jgi:endonuclease/exonuclease/phosphatase family metal-dependent hydrolase
MNIKHLQLNTSVLKHPQAIVDFIQAQGIQIACLQEVAYPTDGNNKLKELCEEKGLHYFEAVHFYYSDQKLTVGSAVVSSWPISDFEVLYFNTPDYQPKTISEQDSVGSTLIDDHDTREPMASRGLKHAIKSRAVAIATLQTPGGPVRVYCMHYTVSSWATETEQMYKLTQMITSHLQFSKSLPTIASGDMNIQADSYSVRLLKTQLEYHTGGLKNTLSDDHRALTTDFPEGLAVDHVFSKQLEHKDTKAVQVDFSDHKAIVSEFILTA